MFSEEQVNGGCCSQAGVGEAVEVPPGAGWGLLAAQWLPLSEPKGVLGGVVSGAPLARRSAP